MAKLIFVNRYFHPDTSATAQLLADLCLHLAHRGWSVTVIASRQLYTDPNADLPGSDNLEGVRILRCRTTRFGRAGLVGRLLDYVSFYVSAFLRVLGEARSDDIVIAKTDPPMLGMVLAPAARWRRAKLVNWLQDLFPEVVSGLSGHGFGVLRRLRNRSLMRADANVVIGAAMRDYLLASGVPGPRITLIHNWAPAGLVPVPAQANPLRSAWGLEGRFVIGYSGNLGRAHEADTLLEAADRLRHDRRFVFLVVGAGEKYRTLRAAAKAAALQNVVFQPYQPRAELSNSLSVPDVHLVSLLPALEGFLVPSKIYGIAAVGRPAVFIGSCDGEVARILDDGEFGATVAPGDVSGLLSVVRSWADDAREHERLCRNAVAASHDRYDIAVVRRLWEGLLENLQRPLA